MAEQVTISFYADRTMKTRLVRLATQEERSVSNLLRRMVDAYVPLSAIDQAVLSQVAKDQGLGSPQEAIGFVIQDWAQQQAREAG